MDLIKTKQMEVVGVTDDILKSDFKSAPRNEAELNMLDEWEMVLASGGEGIPCWGG